MDRRGTHALDCRLVLFPAVMDALDELTQSQKDILSQYQVRCPHRHLTVILYIAHAACQAVTQSDDLDASIARLTDHNWNLEVCILSGAPKLSIVSERSSFFVEGYSESI